MQSPNPIGNLPNEINRFEVSSIVSLLAPRHTENEFVAFGLRFFRNFASGLWDALRLGAGLPTCGGVVYPARPNTG